MQGLSYTLTNLTVPALLTFPSAGSAAKSFHNLRSSAATHVRLLTGISSTAFFLAFCLSPRSSRHPYLLYTAILAGASGLADKIGPCLSSSSNAASAAPKTPRHPARRDPRLARSRMEASYEVLGDGNSEGTGSASGEDMEEDQLNGEEVRGEVENFVKTRLVQATVSALGFMVAVIGIWGDGVAQLHSETIVHV